MRVELPKVLRVFSHELRGPLSVMQGYLRILRTRRVDDETDVRMLTAMLDATGRLTTLARQASDLATWQDGRALAGDRVTLSARALIEGAVAGAAPGVASADVSDEVAAFLVETPGAAALAASLTALVNAVARDTEPPVLVSGRAIGGRRLGVVIRPSSAAAAIPEQLETLELPPLDAGGAPFDQGGHGLALVLAAEVLASHDASVLAIDRPTAFVVTFPSHRGQQ
jgi:signal transduction histidine kinase